MNTFPELPAWNALWIFLFFYFGACVGSFLNVVILRLPRGQKLTGRSHCPNCQRQLKVLDLFPLFSFIFLRGKCRYCGKKISWRYIIIELAAGALFALAFLVVRPHGLAGVLLLLKLWLTIAAGLVSFAVDLEFYVILSNVVLPSAALVVLLNLAADLAGGRSPLALSSLFVSSLAGAAVGSLPIWLLWYASAWWQGEKGLWMGFGDVQLLWLLGAAAGLKLVGVILFLAVVLGGIVSIFLLAFGGKTLKSRVPFGAFLIPAAVLALFYGQQIVNWYFGLLGF